MTGGTEEKKKTEGEREQRRRVGEKTICEENSLQRFLNDVTVCRA